MMTEFVSEIEAACGEALKNQSTGRSSASASTTSSVAASFLEPASILAMTVRPSPVAADTCCCVNPASSRAAATRLLNSTAPDSRWLVFF